MSHTALVCFVLFFFWIDSTLAQSLNPSSLADLAEELVSQQQDESTYEEIYDQLLLRFSEPLDLNSADEEDLRMLYFFTEDQITALIRHRKVSGPFISVLELQGIDFFEVNTLKKWMPFLCIRNATATNWKDLHRRMRAPTQAYFGYRSDGTILSRIPVLQQPGATYTFPGSPWSGSFRLRLSHSNDFSVGWNAERDRGEKFLWDPAQKWFGFDFNSIHFQVMNKPGLKNLILGDYTASFGQGLVMGGGFRVGKGAETITALRRASNGFRPYGSLGESGFFRGVAATIPVVRNWNMHCMVSKVFRDGRVRFSDDSVAFLTTLSATGIHRSDDERQSRKTWSDTNIATAVHGKFRNMDGGVVINHQLFSIPLIPESTIYNRLNFRGQHNTTAGFFVNGQFRNWAFFSETAVSAPSGKTGWVAGVLGSCSPQFDFSFLARNYSPGFHSLHSSAFSEGTNAANEQGVYLGWKFRKGRNVQLAGYSDYFHFPFFKFRLYKPAYGSEHMFRIIRNFSRKNLITFQYRYIRKERNTNLVESTFFTTTPILRQVCNVQFDYLLSEKLTGRTRLSTTLVQADKNYSGFMMVQDLFVNGGKFDFTFRYSIFSVDDYEARIYSYERDVWLSYAFPAWHGYGSRMYFVGQFRLGEKITMWLKWSATHFDDSSPETNGLDEQGKSLRADLRLQLRWML